MGAWFGRVLMCVRILPEMMIIKPKFILKKENWVYAQKEARAHAPAQGNSIKKG